MNSRWYRIIESIKFSLGMLFIGFILMRIGSISTKGEVISLVVSMCGYSGKLIVDLFPFILSINYIGKTHDDVIPVIATMLSYTLLNVVTMFFAKTSFNANYYKAVFGLSYETVNAANNPVIKSPLNLGIIASIIVIIIVRLAYKLSRKRYNYGMFVFIDNDIWFFLITIVFTIVIGALISHEYGYLVMILNNIMNWISNNHSNPAVMFVYGLNRQFLNALGMEEIITNNFLFGNLGGSWITPAEVTILGDVNIWIEQYKTNAISIGTGRYVSASYVTNLFAIPSLIIAYYLNISDKIERNRSLGLVLLGIVASLFGAATLPMELVLMFTAPVLLGIHIIITALIYLACGLTNTYLGCGAFGNPKFLATGNIYELVKYSSDANLLPAVKRLLLIGVVVFVVYQLAVFVFYKLLAHNFLEKEKQTIEVKQYIENLGGISNIKKITSSATSIIVVLYDKEKINKQNIIEGRAYKIIERYYGYIISYGPGSAALCRKISKEIKSYQDCLEYKV
jgi:phosphotransferase system IIB component